MRSAWLTVACSTSACLSPMTKMSPLDEQTVIAAADYSTFARVDRAPYASSVGSFAIDLYVQGDVHGYEQIHPDTFGSNVTIASGTVIVRVVHDASGAVAKLTVMAKAPAGYDPMLGDWWFEEADARGDPLITSRATRRRARSTAAGRPCRACHRRRARTRAPTPAGGDRSACT